MDKSYYTQRLNGVSENRFKRAILGFLGGCLLVLALVVPVMASDVSGAEYYGVVRISNNATIAQNVVVVCNIPTSALIEDGYLNQSCNNSALLTNVSADTAYMPASSGELEWVLWVPSIGAGTSLDYNLYTSGNVSGGKIRYFPADGGMNTIDSDSFEWGDNFTVEQKGWVDTSSGSDKNLIAKACSDLVASDNIDYSYNIFEMSIDGAGNITTSIKVYDIFYATASSGYIRKYDEATWTDAHDAESGDQAHPTGPVDARGFYGEGPNYTIHRGYLFFDTSGIEDSATIADAFVLLWKWTKTEADDDYCNVYLVEGVQDDPLQTNDFGDELPYTTAGGVIDYGDIVTDNYSFVQLNATGLGWINKTGTTKFCVRLQGDTDNITPTGENRARFYSDLNGGREPLLFVATTDNYTSVTASGITSEEYLVKITADTNNLSSYVDDELKDTNALNGNSLIDNSENWTFLENGVMPYMEYQKVWIDGVLQQHIQWENTTGNLTDLSGNNHDAIPTFRTTSDDNVTAVLLSFNPVEEAEATGWDISQAGTMIETPEGSPIPELYTELETSHLPMHGLVENVTTESGAPKTMFWFPIPFLIIVIVGIVINEKTQSLLIQAGVIGALLAFFSAMGPLPFIPVVLFGIDAFAILVGSKQIGW